MSSAHKGMSWRLGYAVFCLVYAAWVAYLGLDNFDKVHGEYRQARENLLPAETEKIALEELADQCRREAKRRGRSRAVGDYENPCLTFPETVLAERKKDVTTHLLAEEKRFRRKLAVFYGTFAVFFVVLPLVCFYLLLAFLIWVFRDLKFVK